MQKDQIGTYFKGRIQKPTLISGFIEKINN